MKKERNKDLFLSELRKVPVVQIACERAGLSRQTVYRWRAEDSDFARKMEEALSDGEMLMNDMAESQLLAQVKDGTLGAIKYWLSHRHGRFKKPPDPVPTPEERRQAYYRSLSNEELIQKLKEAQVMHDELMKQQDGEESTQP